MTILNVRHTTVYRYRRPVRLGDHRLMLRPRDSHDLRLIRTNLNFSYLPGVACIVYDPTNGTVNGANLMRVAVTGHHAAVPIAGSFLGVSDDYLDMTVDATVIPERCPEARST